MVLLARFNPAQVREAFERAAGGLVVEGYGLPEAAPVTHGNPLGRVGWNRPDTALVLKDGWLRTGDIAIMDRKGMSASSSASKICSSQAGPVLWRMWITRVARSQRLRARRSRLCSGCPGPTTIAWRAFAPTYRARAPSTRPGGAPNSACTVRGPDHQPSHDRGFLRQRCPLRQGVSVDLDPPRRRSGRQGARGKDRDDGAVRSAPAAHAVASFARSASICATKRGNSTGLV
jgi:hypothetical protein